MSPFPKEIKNWFVIFRRTAEIITGKPPIVSSHQNSEAHHLVIFLEAPLHNALSNLKCYATRMTAELDSQWISWAYLEREHLEGGLTVQKLQIVLAVPLGDSHVLLFIRLEELTSLVWIPLHHVHKSWSTWNISAVLRNQSYRFLRPNMKALWCSLSNLFEHDG